MVFFIVYILYIVYYNKLPYPKFTVRREFGIERVLYENISRCYMRSFRQPGSQGQLLATGSSPWLSYSVVNLDRWIWPFLAGSGYVFGIWIQIQVSSDIFIEFLTNSWVFYSFEAWKSIKRNKSYDFLHGIQICDPKIVFFLLFEKKYLT